MAINFGKQVRVVPEGHQRAATTTLQERLKALPDEARPRDAEIKRIVSIPEIPQLSDEELEWFNRENLLADTYNSGWRLWPVQANAVWHFQAFGGLFGPIGVGWGKTLISLMIAQSHHARGGEKTLLLVPPQVYSQLTEHDIQWARTKVPLTFPINRLGKTTAARRIQIAQSGRPGLYILPMSCLSTRDTADLLEGISPDLIIADEAHMLSTAGRSARGRRIRDLIRELEPKVVALSGTITSKSVLDYHTLLRQATGKNCPLPLGAAQAAEWGEVIDSGGSAGGGRTGPLMPLVKWAIRSDPENSYPDSVVGFRRAYQRRLVTCPGVVSTGDAEIGVALLHKNYVAVKPKTRPGYGDMQEHLTRIDDEWVTPAGDEIDHAIHTYKWKYELSAGFYNNLVWPTPEELAQSRDITIGQAKDELRLAQVAHELHQEFSREMRSYLEFPIGRFDTPLAATQELAVNGSQTLPQSLHSAWVMWKEACWEGMPERYSVAVRVCDYKIYNALMWVDKELPKGEGAILWVFHKEIGVWLYEQLVQTFGRDRVLHCPAGPAHNETIRDHVNRKKLVVASVTAHGTGKNLQHFQHQLYVQWPRDAKLAEQSLGRIHRNGQTADEVIAHRCDILPFDEMNFAASLADAVYIHQSTGLRQKLVIGSYDPMPKVFPPSLLHEKGFQNTVLTGDSALLWAERFGNAE